MSPAPKDPKAAKEAADLSSASSQKTASRDRDKTLSPRAMLNGTMHLIATYGLGLRLPMVEPGDECATYLRHRLLAIGILRPAPEISSLICPLCGNPSVEAKRSDKGEYAFHCEFCASDVDIPDENYKILAFSLDTLFAFLAKAFGAEQHVRPWEMLPGLLWEMGELSYQGQPVKLLFAYVRNLNADAAILDHLNTLPISYRGLVLLSHPSAFIQPAQIHQRRIVALLRDEATLDMNGLHLKDRDALLSRFDFGGNTAMQPAELKIESDLKGHWVRVNGVEARVRGAKQRKFILAMVAAFRKGIDHPKVEDMLRSAGYSESVSELNHVCRRPDFHAVIGYGNGEVWFKPPARL